MKTLLAKAAKLGLDGFLMGLIGMIILAYIFPFPGAHDSPVPLAKIANYGVSVIFFFYGLRLSPEKLKAGLSNWKLHVSIHVCTFILFPVIIIAAHQLFPNIQSETMWLGMFYLAALPSTVSSSVVMVSIARGNMPAAIFNASISSLLGIFITPLWMEFWTAENSGENIQLQDIIIKLLIQVLLPVVLGLLLHQKLGWFAEKHNTRLKKFDQAIILLIVYTAFCESFTENIFASLSLVNLLLLMLYAVGLFFAGFGLISIVSKLFGFNREDRITFLFCGSKKSLVHGTVMSKVLFPTSDQLGLILLPLMIYHALQLMIASIIANKMTKDISAPPEDSEH